MAMMQRQEVADFASVFDAELVSRGLPQKC